MGNFEFITIIFVALTLTYNDAAVRNRAHQFGCYPELNPRHSGCLPDNGSCFKLGRGVSQSEIAEILDFHNKVRTRVALGEVARGWLDGNQKIISVNPTASRMHELVWDDELAIIAQNWADQCVDAVDCSECRSVDRFKVGQNRYWYQVTPYKGGYRANWTQPMAAWQKHDSSALGQLGIREYTYHQSWAQFSQMIWGETRTIGCGFAAYNSGSWVKFSYVCNYGPSGNIVGHEVYKTGVPCSECRDGEACLNNALCSNARPLSGLVTPNPLASKPCDSSCRPSQLRPFCDEASIRTGTNCPSGHVCCRLTVEKYVTRTSVATQPQTEVVPAVSSAPRKCQSTCVRVELVSLCERSSIDLGKTSCVPGEICCKPTVHSAFPTTTSPAPTDIDQAQTDTGSKTDPTETINGPDSSSCPNEYSCVPTSMQNVCDNNSVRHTSDCKQVKGRVCCRLNVSTLEQTSRDPDSNQAVVFVFQL